MADKKKRGLFIDLTDAGEGLEETTQRVRENQEDSTGPIESMFKTAQRFAPSALTAAFTPGGPYTKLAMFGLGAGLEALMPSESPGAETGATLGSIGGMKALDLMTGGKSRGATFLAKVAADTLGTTAGLLGGDAIDNLVTNKQPDAVFNIGPDKMALYIGASPLGIAAGELIQSGIKKGLTKSAQFRQDISTVNRVGGVDMPFSIPQAERGETGAARSGGLMGFLEEQLFTNSPQQQALAKEQSEKGLTGLSKMLGLPEDDMLRTTEFAEKFFPEFKSRIEALPKQVEELSNKITTGKMSKAEAIGRIQKLQDDMGIKLLSAEQADVLMSMKDIQKLLGKDAVKIQKKYASIVAQNPDNFLAMFVPSNEALYKNLDQLKTLIEVATPEESSKIGAAIIQLALAKNKALVRQRGGILVSGEAFGAALDKLGTDRLVQLFGKDKTEGLQALGRLMSAFEPAETIMTPRRRITETSRTGVYTGRRIFLLAASTAGASAVGGAAGGLGGAVAGATAGATVALPLAAIINGTLKEGRSFVTNLEKAMLGDPAAMSRVMRVIVARPLSEPPSADFRVEQPARSRLRGLLRLGD